MPYSRKNPPDWLKNLPEGAQEIGIEVFNKVLAETGDEDKARQASWAAIKNKYRKEGDEWVRMSAITETITISLSATPDVPNEFLIFPFGKITGLNMEPIYVDQKSVESIRMAHKARGVDIVIDYEHQSLHPVSLAPAAGWIREFFDRGGLACRAEWTPRAAEFIRNREYRYLSPVAYLEEDTRRLISIFSIALTNTPKGNNMPPLVMKAIEPISIHQTKEEIMLKKLLELLGLPGDTTEEKALEAMSARLKLPAASEVMTALSLNPAASVQAVMSAITTLKAAPANVIACTEVMSELGLAATVGKSEIIATIRALKQAKDHGISNAEFEAMKAEIANSKATKLVEEAMSAGKITAAQKDWAQNYAKTDPGGFKLFCEKAPVVVSMKAVEDKKVVKDPMADLTSTDREMMKMFGLTEEDFKKHYKPVVI